MTHTDGWVAPMDDDPFHDLIYSDPDLLRVDFDEIVSAAREPATSHPCRDVTTTAETHDRPDSCSVPQDGKLGLGAIAG